MTFNESPAAKRTSRLRKRNVLLMAAAVTAVALTGVGALATSTATIANNKFTEDAISTGFTFTGSPFDAHYNDSSKSAKMTWTAKNLTPDQTATFDGNFTLTDVKKKDTKKKAFANHLTIEYELYDDKGALLDKGDGGTLANSITLTKAFGVKSLTLAADKSDTLVTTVTWDGKGPKPSNSDLVDTADFNVGYQLNNNS